MHTMMDILSENSKNEYPKSVTELIVLHFIQGVGLIKRGSTIYHCRSRCKGWILWSTPYTYKAHKARGKTICARNLLLHEQNS
jgi:hypothetical protein